MTEESVLYELFPVDRFSQTARKEIIAAYQLRHFKKNDFLLKEDDIAKVYYFVESGYFRSFATDQNGQDVSTGFFRRKDVAIDWPSFLLRKPSLENIQALSDGACWELDFDGFQKLFHEFEAFRNAGRTRLVSTYFELKRKSVSTITDSAKDRYLKLLSEKPDLLQHVSLKHIASYLGITDTSLSRIRKEVAIG